MTQPNPYGIYPAEIVDVLARSGERSYAEIRFCQCDDGLYRYAHSIMYSYGGSTSPITGRTKGFQTLAAAREDATKDLIARFPRAWASEPQSVHDELKRMKAQIEASFKQPSLFDRLLYQARQSAVLRYGAPLRVTSPASRRYAEQHDGSEEMTSLLTDQRNIWPVAFPN